MENILGKERPVSLKSVICIIRESIIQNSILEYLWKGRSHSSSTHIDNIKYSLQYFIFSSEYKIKQRL